MAVSVLQASVGQERILTLDLWRGFALLGVCVVNFISANNGLLTTEQADSLWSAGFDWRMHALVNIFLGNKAHTIFSFMFGVGLAIITERARQAGVHPTRVVIRRLAILLVFGWFHYLFIYDGDILHVYAGLGLIMFLALRNLGVFWITALGLLFALFGRVVFEEREYLLALAGHAVAQNSAAENSGLLAGPVDFGLTEYARMNFADAVSRTQEFGRNFCVNLYYLGRIMLGYAFWVSGAAGRLLACGPRPLWSGAAALYLGWLVVWAAASALGDAPTATLQHLVYNLLRQANFLVLSSAYLVSLVAIVQSGVLQPLVCAIGMAGRMSLTTYVLQSFGMILIFTPAGLGLGGEFGVLVATLVAALFYGTQVLISVFWLRRFRQGPLEWGWRRLIYA